MRSRWLRLAAAAAAVSLLAACGTGSGSQEKTQKLTISATGVDSLPFMAILQAGVDMGWFKEEGLELDLYSGGGGGNTLRVTTSGDADMAISGNSSVVLAAEQPGSNLTVVAPWFQVNDFHWLSSKQAPAKGATIGFSSAGSSTELLAKGLDRKLGTTSQPVGAMGDNWTAVKAGEITAGWAMQPFVAEKKAEEGAQTFVNARDQLGDIPADLVAVNDDYAETNPENVRKFFRVAERLNNWVINDTQAAADRLAPLVGVKPEIMRQALQQTPELAKAYSLKVDPAALDNLSQLMVQAGQIDEPVDWAETIDQQYLPESAQAEL